MSLGEEETSTESIEVRGQRTPEDLNVHVGQEQIGCQECSIANGHVVNENEEDNASVRSHLHNVSLHIFQMCDKVPEHAPQNLSFVGIY